MLVPGQGPLPPWANLERSAPVAAPKTPPKGKSREVPVRNWADSTASKRFGFVFFFCATPSIPVEEGSKGSVVPVPSSVGDSGKSSQVSKPSEVEGHVSSSRLQ